MPQFCNRITSLGVRAAVRAANIMYTLCGRTHAFQEIKSESTRNYVPRKPSNPDTENNEKIMKTLQAEQEAAWRLECEDRAEYTTAMHQEEASTPRAVGPHSHQVILRQGPAHTPVYHSATPGLPRSECGSIDYTSETTSQSGQTVVQTERQETQVLHHPTHMGDQETGIIRQVPLEVPVVAPMERSASTGSFPLQRRGAVRLRTSPVVGRPVGDDFRIRAVTM